MALEVDEERLGPPSPNGLDVTIRDTVLIQCHGNTRMEQMGANILRVEPQPEETDVHHPQAKYSHNILACERPSKTVSRSKLGAYSGINVGLMKIDMNKFLDLRPYRSSKG